MWQYLNRVLCVTCVLVAAALSGQKSFCMELKTISVTDTTGTVESLDRPTFYYSDDHRNNFSEHLQISLPGSPRKDYWIHYSQITKANFQAGAGTIKVSVRLINGDLIEGIFPDSELDIKGKGILGTVEYPISKVRSIEFVKFAERGSMAMRLLSLEEYATEWQQKRVFQSKWKLVDGDRERAIQHFAVYDAYDTNYGCFQALFSERVIKGGKLADRRLEVMRGSTKYELPIEEIEQLQFTGKKIENKPEIVISKRNGLKIACTLLLRSRLMCTPPRGKSMVFSIKEAEVSETHGIENDDMILFARPFGWEGVSLLPIRPIKIARLRADDVITADAKEQPKEKKDTIPPVIEIISPSVPSAGPIVTNKKDIEVRGIIKNHKDVKSVTVNANKAETNASGEFSSIVHLAEGSNLVVFKAIDKDGNEATRQISINYESRKLFDPFSQKEIVIGGTPSLWLLSIGVSTYKDPGLSLKYAHQDAIALADIFKRQEGKLYSEVFVKTLINEQCTRANILESLAGHLGKAAPDDVVLIFVAGHGIRHKQTGSYYFLTYDTNLNNLIYEALKWSDFEEAIKIISTNVDKVVLAADTCHAGAMKTQLRGIGEGEDLAHRLKESSGLYILASSKSGEASVENEKFKPMDAGAEGGHGAFTYSILKGLSGEANYDNDSYISVHELFKYVAKMVPRITAGAQHPYSRFVGTDMPLAVAPK